MPNLSLTKTWNYLATSTIERISPFISDVVTGRVFLLHVLDQSGMRQRVNGGTQLVLRLLNELPTATDYSDLDTLNPARANPIEAAIFNWKQFAVPIQISGRDMLINSGSDVAMTNILTLFVEAAIASARNQAGGSSGIFSANTEASRGITGLQNLITHVANAAPTTGTAGNLDRSTRTYWRNRVVNVASDFSVNGYDGMIDLYTQCQRGDETPGVIALTRAAYFNYLRNSIASIRFNVPLTAQQKTLDIGFSNVTFLNAIIGPDDGVPADFGYFLTPKYVHWMVHSMREFELGPVAFTPSLDALSGWLYFAGNLGLSAMLPHGLLRNADTN